MDWFNTVPDGLFVEDGDHADEMETSMMQYLRPDWVLPLSEAGDGYEHKFNISALKEGWVWTQRDWTRATADTGIGNPHLATADKGKRCLQQAGAQIAGFLVDFAAADVDDLYE